MDGPFYDGLVGTLRVEAVCLLVLLKLDDINIFI
jgi:hypothetical protein